MVLITHLGLTRDPPQKWFPFLHTGGQRSDTARQSVFYLFTVGSYAISSQTHLSLRLTVHGAFPGIPCTMRILDLWMRSSLFPHSLNSTFSAFTKRRHIIVETRQKACRLDFEVLLHIHSETNLLLQSWALSLQLFENNKKQMNQMEQIATEQELWINCHHTVH